MDGCGRPGTPLGDLRIRRLWVQVLPGALLIPLHGRLSHEPLTATLRGQVKIFYLGLVTVGGRSGGPISIHATASTARTFTDVLFVDATSQGNLWEPFSRSDYTSQEITEAPHSHNLCLIDDVGGAAGLSPDLVIDCGYRCVRRAAIVRP